MPQRRPFVRPAQGRWVAGVCAGLADHLGVPMSRVRIAMVLLALAGGAGVALYLFWWVVVPEGEPDSRPAELSRLARPPRQRIPGFGLPAVLLGCALLAAAVLLILEYAGLPVDLTIWLPLVLLVAGAALVWTQLDAPATKTSTIIRVAGGGLLATAGVVALVSRQTGTENLLRSLLAALAILVAVGVVLSPWLVRWFRSLSRAQEEKVRETARADIAAHLHDSVLQSLALIRTNSADAATVARIARRQERELREWLYVDRNAPGTSVASELKTVVAQVEDDYAVAIEPIIVGDAPPTTRTEAAVGATAEALKNAARHGAPPITLYAEFSPDLLEIFVRDQGSGFDPSDLPADHFGVRESILGRVRRAGGTAVVDVRPGRGTEIRLTLPLKEEGND